nr:b(0,+)-type amino acid transporter 1 [Parasteatoda tepidariorum]
MKGGVLDRVRGRSLDDDEEGESLKSPVGQKEEVRLKREVGLLSAVFLIVGTMIGSGIFISPKGVLVRSGSVGASLIVWAGCGLISLFGALCYAELGTSIPVSGAEYSYFLHVYGKKGRFGPVPAFLYMWMCSIIIKPAAVSIMLLTFSEYIVTPFFPTCSSPDIAKKLIALAAIFFITFINCYSVKLATRMNNFFTVAKLSAIAIVVLIGIYRFSTGHYEHINTGFAGTTTSFSDLATAFYFGLWAYDGWNNLNFVTEELINASVGFANRMLGPVSFIIPILVAASAYGASNGTALIASRLPFVAARQGHSIELMSYVQVKRLTPAPALIFNGMVVFLMISAGNIGSLIDFFSFVAWMFYGGTMFTVIVLRFTEKDLPRPYRVPTIIPLVMAVVAAYLVLAPIIEDPRLEYFYALLFLCSGFLFYIPFVHFDIRLKMMKNFTHFVQLAVNCAPQN